MRILHVIAYADPKLGGPIEGIKQRGMLLQKMGHEVEVVSNDAPDSAFRESFPLPMHLCGPPKSGFAYSANLKPWLMENAPKYDALIANGIWQYPNIILRQVARKLNKPYWVFTHGMLDPWFNKAYPIKRLKKQMYWTLQHAVLRDAKAVLFTCEEEKLLARQSFKPYNVRERVVNYGTAGPVGSEDAQRQAFREAYPDLRDKRYLLFLSRIHPKKGADLLLNSFREASRRDPDLHLALAGPVDDAYKAELSAILAGSDVANKVHWLGMVKDDIKWGAFRESEAFVLPSHQENFGISVVEALACAKPVLITKPINIWREIEADGAGLIVEDDQPGIDKVLSDWQSTPATKRAAMGAAARTCFENRFTVQKSADSLLEVLNER